MFRKKSAEPRFGVVIVAGGNSSRMKGVDKQGLWLGDYPVPIRAMLPFQACEQVREIAVVCREDFLPTMMEWVRDFGLSKVSAIVRGGSSRQQSVLRGIEALSEHVDYFAIHDGARPFVDAGCIERCISDVLTYGAATAAVPCKDTIKVSDSEGFIVDTPDRSTLHQTQTPQMFRRDWYLEAVEQAKADGVDCTDDCQLLERMGRKVHLSMGSYFNIKITTPEDLPIAHAIAEAKGGK